MTVKELINALSLVDENLEVMISSEETFITLMYASIQKIDAINNNKPFLELI